MNYEIKQNFITKNRSFEVLNAIGVVVHETATPNATDENEREYFNNNSVNASVHAFVDYDSITQTIPWDEVAWGAGYTANRKFIHVELCHFDGDRFIEVWNRGVWLFAWIFINVLKTKTVTSNNLFSHQEISEIFGETNHTDPYQFFLDNGKTIDDFRNDVQQEIINQTGGVNMSFDDAIQLLVDKKIITDSLHWKMVACVVRYFDILIIKIATFIRDNCN